MFGDTVGWGSVTCHAGSLEPHGQSGNRRRGH